MILSYWKNPQKRLKTALDRKGLRISRSKAKAVVYDSEVDLREGLEVDISNITS